MSWTPRKSAQLFVEPLEARIAPTGLVAITDPNNTIGTDDPRYINYNTLPTAGKLGFVPGSNYGIAGSDIYAIALNGNGSTDANGVNTGDKLLVYNPALGFNFSNPFLQSANGNIVAFFRDANGDHNVQNTELIGISMGAGAAVNVNGTVHGDIVDNLGTDGLVKLAGAVKVKQSISGINVVGDVTGNILAGGSINNVAVSGDVHGIFNGTAANGAAYYFGDPGAVSGTLKVPAPKINASGPSITNVSVASITDSIRTGDGGFHGAGGSILNTVVQNDVGGFSLLTGNGGGGDLSGVAGQGGVIANLTVKGVIDATGSRSLISVATGHGGENDATKGAKGGAIIGVAISYDSFDPGANTGSQSVDHLNDNVIIHSGDGGIGQKGGKGGAVTNINVITSTADDGNPNNAETQIIAGNGGVSTIADIGRGGRGGDLNQIFAENLLVFDLDPTAPVPAGSILVQAGNGGPGVKGGDVNAVTLLGNVLTINAGNGADGFNHGGLGGSVNTVNILNLSNIFATDVTINAGSGGIGFNGAGGVGGSITAVRMLDSHLNSLTINSGNHGNGGVSNNGIGGAGGTVTDVIVNDSGDFLAQGSPVTLRTGNGGDGTLGAGAGGDLADIQIIGTDLAYKVSTGNGGSVTGDSNSNGGQGGFITNVGIANVPVTITALTPPNGIVIIQTQISNANTATVTSGNGGNATNGLGGVGGDITKLDVVTNVNVTPIPDLTTPAGFQPDNYIITAGNGGSGAAGPGKGADISASAAASVFGSVTVRAGDAGGSGAATASGGALDGFVAAALGPISLTSGNGGAGGAGGNITNSGTNLTPVTATDPDFGTSTILLTNNRGGLTVHAGNGSVANKIGGAGGSITNFSGYISNGGVTSITAGNGGSAPSKFSGAGGSVDQIKLTGLGNDANGNPQSTGGTVTVDAGDAGIATKSKRGADGGSTSNVTIYNVDPGTVVHHIAAGDGGSGRITGGAGGSVSAIHVGLTTETVDIGYRTGRVFGYDVATQAGGIFAGNGGQSVGGTSGVAGSVTDVTAAAIASIVAGKSGAIGSRLASTVGGIFLNGLAVPVGAADGSLTNLDTANFVGSIANPGTAGASTFVANRDGLIAALNLGSLNFVPEATLTLVNEQLVLADRQEPNGIPVIISM